MSFTSRSAVLCLVLALLVPHARPALCGSSEAEARAFYQAGHSLFEAGRYREAIVKFQAGYALSPRPMFLLNIGQAYRQLFEPARARESYVAFLTQAAPDDPSRPEVEELVREIDRVLAEQARQVAREPVREVVAVAPPPRAPFVKRHWWIFPVSAVVLAGVGVGIYFAVRPSHVGCGDATIGCLDAMR